jgi:3-oxoadipate enol-lactonase
MPTALINGINLYYEEQGRGDPLLLIMGFSAHSMMWMMQTPVLAQHFRVITFDNRGVGRSDAPEGPYSTRQMADDASGLLEHLGIERAHVVGWSMGGMIAQELALNHANQLDRLVLMASLAHASSYAGAWLTYMTQATQLVADGTLDPTGFAVNSLPWMFTPAMLAQPPVVELALQQTLQNPFPATPQGIAGQAEACRAHIFGDALQRLSGITAPTLVLVGAEDILTPALYSREMAERIPDARLQVLDRGGHGVPIEYAAAVNEALLAFLKQPVAAASD